MRGGRGVATGSDPATAETPRGRAPRHRPARRPSARENGRGKAARGRPSGLTAAIADRLVAEVREHYHVGRAAQLLGVPPATAREWVRRGEGLVAGRPATREFAAFAAAIKAAQAENSVNAIRELRQAAKGGQLVRETVHETVNGVGKVTGRSTTRHYSAPHWQANAWWLERTDRDDLRRPVDERQVEGAVTLAADTELLLRAVVKVLHKYLGPRAHEALVEMHQLAGGSFAPVEQARPEAS